MRYNNGRIDKDSTPHMITVNAQNITIPLILTLVAGLSTTIGSLAFFSIKNFEDRHLVLALGLSAGAMLYISLVELLRTAIEGIGFVPANLYFFVGVAVMMLIDFLIPHQYLNEKQGQSGKHKSLYSTGVLIAFGIAIHNLPEGLAVFLSGLSDLHLGIALAVAIAIHNIPEGVAICIPIYYATKSKTKAFTYSFLSGMVEPLGAVIGLMLIGTTISPKLIDGIFAFVAGIMVFICFDELLPQAFTKDQHKPAITGIFLGIIIMMMSLSF